MQAPAARNPDSAPCAPYPTHLVLLLLPQLLLLLFLERSQAWQHIGHPQPAHHQDLVNAIAQHLRVCVCM